MRPDDADPGQNPLWVELRVHGVSGSPPESMLLSAHVVQVGGDEIDEASGRRCCGPDWRLLDPTPSDIAQMTSAVATLRGHGDYPADPDWARVVTEVLPPLGVSPRV